MRKLLLFLFILTALAIVAVAGYLGFQSSAPATAEPTATPPPTVPVTICDVEQTITAPGSLVNLHEAWVEMPLDGQLAEVAPLRPGDSVTAGQVLTRLAGVKDLEAAVGSIQAQIAAAQLEVLQAQAGVAALKAAAPLQAAQAYVALTEAQTALEEAQKAVARLDYSRASQTTIDEAQAKLNREKATLDEKQKAYDALSDRPLDDWERTIARAELSDAERAYNSALTTLNYYKGRPSESERQQATARLQLAELSLAQAQTTWEALQNGPDPLDLAVAEAKITDAEAKVTDAQTRLARAQENLTKVEILAPFSGVVLEVKARLGETFPAGSQLFRLNDPLAVEVETTVIEEDLPYVTPGQPADLYFDALPGEILTGTVSRIVPLRAPGDRPLYYVYIRLSSLPASSTNPVYPADPVHPVPASPSALIAGMNADASIVIAQQKGALCLPRALAQAAADGTASVQVWANNQIQRRQITVGLRGDTMVAILSGLQEGDLVVAK